MTGRTVALIMKICGIALAVASVMAMAYTIALAHQRPPPLARTQELILYGQVLLVAVSVRLFIFGNSIGKRLEKALILSLLLSVIVCIFPDIGQAWISGGSIYLWPGLVFVFIEFIVPCVVLSVVLSLVPLFDERFGEKR
jgi:hypothetical protein